MSTAPIASGRGRGWYGAAVASWFGSFGMQSLLFSWLIVGELNASAEWVGIAQTSSALPQLALLLLGGAVADRLEPRRMLAVMHVAAALPALALAAVITTGNLSLASVISYGVSIGAINAFLMPARDSLLSRVAGSNMIRAVTAMTVVQFGAQIAGTLVAGTSEWLGSSAILVLQALLLASGAWFALRLPRAPSRAGSKLGPSSLAEEGLIVAESARSSWHRAGDGLREVWANPALWATLMLVTCVGLFFIGPFTVVFPVLVRDFYAGGAQDLSIVLMLFPLGTIAGSFALRAAGPIRFHIRATMLALLSGSALLAAVGTGPPWWVFLLLTLGWGLAGSVFINLSRAVFQERATPDNRARVLAVYQLGIMGGSPIGSLMAGFLAGSIGPHPTLYISSAAMAAVVLGIWLMTNSSAIE